MASPASPTSPASSASSFNHPLALDELVNHFVASKRSLNSQTVLWRANDIVNSARSLLEENAVLSAKNSSVRNIIEDNLHSLEAVRRAIDDVENEVQAEFKVWSGPSAERRVVANCSKGYSA